MPDPGWGTRRQGWVRLVALREEQESPDGLSRTDLEVYPTFCPR